MAAKTRSQQKDHEFSMSSGQMVGALVGMVVSLLIAFIAGLLIGRYETTEDLYAMQQRVRQTGRMTMPLKNTSSQPVSKKTIPANTTKKPATKPAAKPAPAKRPIAASKPAQKPAAKKPAPAAVKKPVPPVKKPAAAKVAVMTKTSKKPTAKPATKPAAKPAAKFGVQVAGLSNKKSAETSAARLAKQGYDSWVRPPSGGGHLYGVMIGHFTTRAKAVTEMRTLRKTKAFADAWVP